MRFRCHAALFAGMAAGVLSCAEAPTRTAPEPGSTASGELLGSAHQLTFDGRRSGEGYFSRDGRQLVFQSEREPGNPFFQIYWMDLETGRVERASPGRGKTTCAWIHPSGARLLFSSTHLDPASEKLQAEELRQREAGEERRYEWDYDPHFDIFSVRLPPDGGEPVRLTSAPGYDAEASWSPDGHQIVFASNRHIYGKDGELLASLSAEDRRHAEAGDLQRFVDLYVMDARGGAVRRLTESMGYDGGPFFSPDGKRIVWRRFSDDGARAEIFSMQSDGSDVRQLTSLGVMSWAPFYHPSGDYVIFSTNLHGFENFELYLVASDGPSTPVRVTDRDGFDGLPAFSPDGGELVFTRKARGEQARGAQLYRAAWNDAVARERLGLPPATVRDAGPILPVPARLVPEIREEELRSFVEALASDAAEGRMTGSPGEKIATSYVARVFRSLGLEPAGDAGTYFQEFGFTAGVSLGGGNRLLSGDRELVLDRDWRPLAFSRVGEVPPSEVVFAGYGLVAPEESGRAGLDDYAHLDVEGRWVLVLRFVPDGLVDEDRRWLHRHSSLRYKAMVARDKGARGILFASGPHSKVREELVPLRTDASLGGTSIAAVSLSDEAADALLRSGSSHGLADLQAALDRGIEMPGFALEGVRLAATLDIQQQRKKGRNVLARLPASRPPPAAGEDGVLPAPPPVLLIGAHVDHLGRGEGTTSLARDAEQGAVHHGADDNASGVAALLEIAAYLAGEQAGGRLETTRDVVFAAWSGEELGLLGSAAYAEELLALVAPAQGEDAQDLSSRIAAYLNMDMIGRLRSELSLQGVESSPLWAREIESRNVAIGLPIVTQADGYLPTDATTFYLRRVPVLSAFTGSHEEYHTPRDRPERLDYPGLARIARLVAAISEDLAVREEAPVYVAASGPAPGLPRAGLRVYLGTIPDYTSASDTPGLKLSGVAAGGPADQAGLRAGDIVIEVDGRAIENIYDYTYSLESLEVGVPARIVVLRGDSQTAVMLTPTSRD